MNYVISLLKYMNIADTDVINNNNNDYNYDNEIIGYPILQRKIQLLQKQEQEQKQKQELELEQELEQEQKIQYAYDSDKEYDIDKECNNNKECNIYTSKTMKKPFEVHDNMVLVNAYYYTFWLPINEFKRYYPIST